MKYENIPAEKLLNVAVKPVLMRAIDRFRALLPGEVELAIEVPHDSPRIRAHAQQLEEAILSACMVAWQSMGGLASQIVVEMKEVSLDEVILDFDAEKLRGGLPPRAYIWLVISNSTRTPASPFHTLMQAPTTVDERPSSACRLKLLEIRHVIEQHHGTMTALPEPEKGTAFDIYLPTAIALEIPALNESSTDIKHIIYVDDYDAMRDLISEILPDAGFRVNCYESSKDAIAAFLKSPFKYDALVSDYRLQGASGIDLLRKVKLMRPDMPVIIISGYVDDALKANAMGEGASLVMSKTSDLNQLCVELRSLLATAPNAAMGSYSEWARL
ncbi:MAG: response regulator [Polaromonas sp.]|nr:response regulator [Polaromonas sp.]